MCIGICIGTVTGNGNEGVARAQRIEAACIIVFDRDIYSSIDFKIHNCGCSNKINSTCTLWLLDEERGTLKRSVARKKKGRGILHSTR